MISNHVCREMKACPNSPNVLVPSAHMTMYTDYTLHHTQPTQHTHFTHIIYCPAQWCNCIRNTANLISTFLLVYFTSQLLLIHIRYSSTTP